VSVAVRGQGGVACLMMMASRLEVRALVVRLGLSRDM
jgi:hypothetical protein